MLTTTVDALCTNLSKIRLCKLSKAHEWLISHSVVFFERLLMLYDGGMMLTTQFHVMTFHFAFQLIVLSSDVSDESLVTPS
jgi:hypothetical protein